MRVRSKEYTVFAGGQKRRGVDFYHMTRCMTHHRANTGTDFDREVVVWMSVLIASGFSCVQCVRGRAASV